ncbi:MAG: ABC transporter ATP-binding protein [Candidatus Rokubacteria bacterium]|nr:ABC transporter ATP-binding protein [Candidatus Rokubacteria bacterium]
MGAGNPFDDDIAGKAYDARLMARLWAVSRPHRGVVLLTALLFFPVAALELLQPYLLKLAIDHHILPGDWPGLTWVALAFLATLILLYALRAWQSYLTHLTGQRVIHDLRHALFVHLQRMDQAFLDRNPVGRLMTRVLNDVEAISEVFTAGLVSILGDVLTLAGVVVVMLGMNWKLALVTFSLVPVLFAIAAFFRARARTAYRLVRTRLARLNAFLQESLQGMAVTQLFTREIQERRAFEELNRDYRRAQFRSTIYDASLYAAVEAIGSAAVALLLWYGGGQIWAGVLTFGGLVAFIEYTNRFFLPIRDLGAKYAVMQSAMASSERVFGLLDLRPAIASPPAPREASPVRGAIELRQVWFAYAGEDWVLRDCSFGVAPGERVALVGATGEGKTTIARLLNRSYDVARGQVLVDGVDVREWELPTLRRAVGLIPQDVFLFTGTLEANLRLSSDGPVSRDALERAVAMANARRLVESLPDGYRQEIRERGANLSQGERQLLAIARALVYNPAVLVLDEATSSVDPESEALIQEAMARLLAGRTSLIIAHRLSTIRLADRILVLHNGRVREEGSHGELLRRGGLYARLYELQFVK